ncbi:hypothetical protein Rhe02_41770 [Rhizocola hellebori]|uniref:Secreted protein n=1 Tax=Rhizocola hellebori TaxID=1392758 RepID=A0A8J3QAN2_9ACTN|nr:hypothetical protein [Rhizocola hellebori]GIH06110.1 hypothetical protein Rhe02_41770 [Rhizocola hellebori]
MRRVRAAAVIASIALGLVMGAGSPAQAAVAPSGGVSVNYQFGMYYSQWACQYFGNSLVQGGAFHSYSCVYQYYQPDNAYYWFLYVY